MDGLCPTQEKVVEYARAHEGELREIAKSMCVSYLDTLSFDELVEKFVAGARAHGAMPLNKDWGKEAVQEAKDLFWYVAMMQQRVSTHPVLDETN